MFDKVLFLGQGGRTVYNGAVDDAENYFASIGYPLPPYVNPADFYMDVIAGSVTNERNIHTNLFDEWEKHCTKVEGAQSKVETVTEEGEVGQGNEGLNMVEVNDDRRGSRDSNLSVGIGDNNRPSDAIAPRKKMSTQILIYVKDVQNESMHYQLRFICEIF